VSEKRSKAVAETIDGLIDRPPSRFVVGIDLGTTNSAVTYVDSSEAAWRIRVFNVLQPVSATDAEALDTLPSFYYQTVSGSANFDFCVGAYARDETAKTSGRGIASAKSWLCHAAVDRTAAILPWHGAPDVRRLSPVEVSSAYLNHIRQCWDNEFPEDPLALQDLVVTLPASFDEVARELTIEAAKQAGLNRLLLIEEPQAAFYAWVYKHENDWDQRVHVGQKILVCDIGGGTSDFSLIRVRKSELERDGAGDGQGQRIQFHRVAVGNHLILGGDNLDLAIAKYLESKVSGGKLEPFQWDVLVGSSRNVKEQLLSPGAPDRISVNIPGRGSRLIGGGIQIETTQAEICELVLNGFLPVVPIDSRPQVMQSGFQELGLPYASDPAITRYLANFLLTHATAGAENPTESRQLSAVELQRAARPDVVLFNGGFFASPVLQEQLIEQIAAWFQTADEPNWQPVILANDRLDLAVARGAAYYGMVRRDQGIKIAATLARSYYLGIGGEPPKAICIMPGSAEPEETFALNDRNFKLTVSQPVEFSLYVSSIRLADQPGMVIDINPEQLSPLPPIRTVLKTKSRNEKGELPVQLQIRLTELGTVDLACQQVDSDRRWKLQFDVRSTTQTDIAQHQGMGESQGVYDESTWEACESLVEAVFGSGTNNEISPQSLARELAETIGLDRDEWPMSLLRRIWGALIERESGRKKSPQHETRWLNLLGYSLRPGYGVALDDWRVTESWRLIHSKIFHPGAGTRSELLVLWRRLAGGLTRGQQLMIGEPWLASLRALARQATGKSTKGQNSAVPRPEESIEVWRLLGSLELMPLDHKRELGNLALTLVDKPRMANARGAMIWALGRLGQRQPLYGPLNTVIPGQVVEGWIESLLESTVSGTHWLAITQMARMTGDRYRDIGAQLRQRVLDWLVQCGADKHLMVLVREGGRLEFEEQAMVFGESLPPGLRLE
jgi:hypothetical protein